MASKRMFDKAIIDTDNFCEMMSSAKALYFLLGMEADDRGFVSPKRVMRMHNHPEDDLKVLKAKKFVIGFESGVIVITDWLVNNYLDNRRIKETIYLEEFKLLEIINNVYILKGDAENPCYDACLANAQQMLREKRIEENRREENRIEEKRDGVVFETTFQPKKQKSAKEIEKAEKRKQEIDDIIAYLNFKTGKSFRAKTGKTRSEINARIEEKATHEQFKHVIDLKVATWTSERMKAYIRPSTLFNATNFWNYVNESFPKPRGQNALVDMINRGEFND